MTIEQIVDYVMHTPYNTNRAVLTQMLKALVNQTEGGDDGGEEGPDEIIYDGGEEH